jgi:uncharacterized SAM-binding protein YcdF (DUF218 family)
LSWISYSSLIPPNLFILLAMIGVAAAWRTKRLGLALATAAVGCLYLASLPVVAGLLMRSAEALAQTGPAAAAATPPGAIVVLAADSRHSDVPGKADAVGPLTLERLAAAAREYRKIGLPILVSGGPPDCGERSLAALMSKGLQDDFGVPVRWREDRSRNTFENAAYSAAMLRRAGIGAAFVVAHPWDMARALWSFAAVGFPVMPLPTLEEHGLSLSVADFFPQVPALRDSYFALHELIGLAWYRLRYGQG